MYRRIARQNNFRCDLFFFHLFRTFLLDLDDQFRNIYVGQVEHFGRLVQTVQYRDVT